MNHNSNHPISLLESSLQPLPCEVISLPRLEASRLRRKLIYFIFSLILVIGCIIFVVQMKKLKDSCVYKSDQNYVQHAFRLPAIGTVMSFDFTKRCWVIDYIRVYPKLSNDTCCEKSAAVQFEQLIPVYYSFVSTSSQCKLDKETQKNDCEYESSMLFISIILLIDVALIFSVGLCVIFIANLNQIYNTICSCCKKNVTRYNEMQ